MNNRIREKIRAFFMKQNPDYLGDLRHEYEGHVYYQPIFVPRSEVDEYRAKYGDRLKILELDGFGHHKETTSNA